MNRTIGNFKIKPEGLTSDYELVLPERMLIICESRDMEEAFSIQEKIRQAQLARFVEVNYMTTWKFGFKTQTAKTNMTLNTINKVDDCDCLYLLNHPNRRNVTGLGHIGTIALGAALYRRLHTRDRLPGTIFFDRSFDFNEAGLRNLRSPLIVGLDGYLDLIASWVNPQEPASPYRQKAA